MEPAGDLPRQPTTGTNGVVNAPQQLRPMEATCTVANRNAGIVAMKDRGAGVEAVHSPSTGSVALRMPCATRSDGRQGWYGFFFP